MSGGPACQCAEKREPIGQHHGTARIIADGSAVFGLRAGRLWRVVQRQRNYSRFGGGHYQASRYSEICCLRCGRYWRTTADYVAHLADIAPDENQIATGYECHAAEMAKRGRLPHGQSKQDR